MPEREEEGDMILFLSRSLLLIEEAHTEHNGLKLICSAKWVTGQRAGRGRAHSLPPPPPPYFWSTREWCVHLPPHMPLPFLPERARPSPLLMGPAVLEQSLPSDTSFHRSPCFLHLEENAFLSQATSIFMSRK